MKYTIESISQLIHIILKEDPSPSGRERVKKLLEEVVINKEFADQYLHDDQPQRKVLYEDSELGFAILAHVFKEARRTQPHDHGASWAIYAQAEGVTTMDGWDVIEPAELGGKHGKVKLRDSIELKPGNVRVYNENEIHSPRRNGPAKLIRIEGNPNQTTAGRVWEPI
jgi:predicted metal-dependent enzyme (double-stranded beta helix superfamily)